MRGRGLQRGKWACPAGLLEKRDYKWGNIWGKIDQKKNRKTIPCRFLLVICYFQLLVPNQLSALPRIGHYKEAPESLLGEVFTACVVFYYLGRVIFNLEQFKYLIFFCVFD
jgi:hypothetical protein